MRIIAGTAGGRVIAAPKGTRTRPMTGRVRGAIFNILGDAVVGAEVLDLFAGSGSLGLEALSRGAARCLFVERDPAAAAVLRANIETLGFGDRTRVMVADAARAVGGRLGGPFDLVFVDPPYQAAERLDETSVIGGLVGALFDRARDHPQMTQISPVDVRRKPSPSESASICEICGSFFSVSSKAQSTQRRALLKPGGRVILRTPRRAGALWLSAGVEEADVRLYGADCVRFLRHAGDQERNRS